MSEFKSTNNLQFEQRPWFRDPGQDEFRIGTCEGLYFSTPDAYCILVVTNNEKGNGHLQDVFDWFENSCKRDGKNLMILDFFNEKFKTHCINKRGFSPVPGTDHLIKKFKTLH